MFVQQSNIINNLAITKILLRTAIPQNSILILLCIKNPYLLMPSFNFSVLEIVYKNNFALPEYEN